MAGSTGFEPATSGLTVQCANQAAPRARAEPKRYTGRRRFVHPRVNPTRQNVPPPPPPMPPPEDPLEKPLPPLLAVEAPYPRRVVRIASSVRRAKPVSAGATAGKAKSPRTGDQGG